MAAPARYRIKVLEKTLAILDLIGGVTGGLTLAQLSDRLGISKPTAFRIVTVLEHADYLQRAPGSQGYQLGLKLHRLGSLVDAGAALRNLARPFLEELVDRCDDTVHLVVLDRGEALYLDKIEGKRSVRVVSRVGMRLPAHCSGVGKVLLAHADDDEVDAIVRERGLQRFTPNTITDRQALEAELLRIRACGYAIDNEEIELGLKCVAAPVSDEAGRVVAAISVSGPKFRFDDRLEQFVSLVLRTSERISTALRNQLPPEERTRSRHEKLDGTGRKQRLASRG